MNSSTKKDESEIIERLRAQGFRLTKKRIALVEILALSDQPLAVNDLLDALSARDLAANKTTVYRELEFLVSEGIVHELDILDGKKRYELRDGDHHHHHLVCTKCKSITCADVCSGVSEISKSISKLYKFHVTGHVFEFFGLCKKCRPKSLSVL